MMRQFGADLLLAADQKHAHVIMPRGEYGAFDLRFGGLVEPIASTAMTVGMS